MDEPTASFPANEVTRLFAGIERLRTAGVAVIYVSHRLDEVFRSPTTLVVLRDGRVVGQSRVDAISPKEVVIQIVGRAPSQMFRRSRAAVGSARMSISRLALDGVGPFTCDFNRGEVIGLVGLRGAGHDLIGQALFGLAPVIRGDIVLDGKSIAPKSPREAMNDGIELIWGDRNNGSVVPVLSVKENMFLNQTMAGLSPFSYVAPRQEDKIGAGARTQSRFAPEPTGLPNRIALGRQPAEGHHWPLVKSAGESLHLRGSNRRCRCRGQGGHLPTLQCRA